MYDVVLVHKLDCLNTIGNYLEDFFFIQVFDFLLNQLFHISFKVFHDHEDRKSSLLLFVNILWFFVHEDVVEYGHEPVAIWFRV